jgi:hypothetical protein
LHRDSSLFTFIPQALKARAAVDLAGCQPGHQELDQSQISDDLWCDHQMESSVLVTKDMRRHHLMLVCPIKATTAIVPCRVLKKTVADFKINP